MTMRRYDLDWLRVIVFALLIFYHVGMFFVPWGWHIKNNEIYEWLEYPMRFLNQWRLPILFVISGMGTYYAFSKRNGASFAWERIKRLFIPLVIGMLLIVPPQIYIERLANNQFVGSYFQYWPQEAFIGVYPEGNLSWHHLWFLPYLLLFSLLCIPVFLFLRKNPNNYLIRWIRKELRRPIGLYIFLIPIYITEAFVEPFFDVTHALIGDWFALSNYGVFFFFGFVLISVQKEFWALVEQHRKQFFITGLFSFTAYILLRVIWEDSVLIHFTEAFLKVFNLWTWILILFGYAAYYLNRSSKILSYCNQAVYPFYILHQTITIVLAYWIMDLDWSFWIKASILIMGTFLIAWGIYELGIRRWKLIRPLFGVKNR